MLTPLPKQATTPAVQGRTSPRHALPWTASSSLSQQRAFTCRRTVPHAKQAVSSRSTAIHCLAKDATDVADQTDSRLSVDLSSEELASGVNFGKSPDGLFIVVSEVSPGSTAEQAGIVVGQKLLAVSSPMPSGSGGEMLDVTGRSSLRFVKDAIRMNRTSSVSIVLSRLPINMTPVEQEGAISSLLESVAGDEGEDKQTVAEKLARVYKEEEETAYRERTQRQRRIQRRRDYMDRESTRDNTKFFIGLAASLFLPAIGILAYAFSSGLLDNISSGYRPY